MPNTKAPMTSDGPIGAIAPPKPGTSAATGTITTAATAISSSAPSKPAGLAAHEEAPPRRGEAELGLEERRRRAQSRARSARRTPAGRRAAPARPARAAASTAAIRNGQSSARQCAGSAGAVGRSESLIGDVTLIGPLRGLRAEAERLLQVVPLGARRGKRAAAHRRSTRPSSRRRAARPCGRALRTARTSRSPPSGRCCNRSTTGPAGSVAAIAASSAFGFSRLVAAIVERRAVEIDARRECGRRPWRPAPSPCRRRSDAGRASISVAPPRLLDLLHLAGFGEQRLVERRGEDLRRRRARAGLDRICRSACQAAKPPSRIDTAGCARDLQRPVDARGRAEIGARARRPARRRRGCPRRCRVSPISFSSSARVGSMNGTPLRVTRQPALS